MMKANKNKSSVKEYAHSFGAKVQVLIFILIVTVVTVLLTFLMPKIRTEMIDLTDSYMEDVASNYDKLLDVAIDGNTDIWSLYESGKLSEAVGNISIRGIEGSYGYIVAKDGTMLLHPTTEKIGLPVENATVKEVIAKLQAGEKVDPFVTTYLYRDNIQRAAIHPDESGEFVFVIVASEANVIKNSNNLRSTANIMNVILALIFTTAGGIFCFYLTKPLRHVVKEVDRMSNLDFTESDTLKRLVKKSDETGMISKAIVDLQQKLATVIIDVRRQSSDLYTAADTMNEQISDTAEVIEQVSSAVHEIADGAGSQAQDTQDATERVVAMGQAIEQTNTEVENLYTSTGSMKESGDEAVKTLAELGEISKSAQKAIDLIYAQTNTTNESALKIHEATALITSIAEETNLLSLNASIEAARAGEQGRGFAVVAAQIQKLAEQSNASASRIEKIITGLIDESNTAVKTMDEVKEIMIRQADNVKQTENAVVKVREKIDESIQGVSVIAESTKNIDTTRQAVIDLVQNLSAIAEENAANTEETSASVTEVGATMSSVSDNTRQLKDIAKQMEDNMQRFNL